MNSLLGNSKEKSICRVIKSVMNISQKYKIGFLGEKKLYFFPFSLCSISVLLSQPNFLNSSVVGIFSLGET